jgi:DNA-binding response OmpR family regulator
MRSPLFGEPYIMVVEDDLSVGRLFAELLRSEGCQVEVINNGAHAVVEAHKRMPDCIVADIVLPGIDGFRLCEQLTKEFKTIKIVLMTGADIRENDVEVARIRGAEAIIEKTKFREIVATVMDIVSREEKSNS